MDAEKKLKLEKLLEQQRRKDKLKFSSMFDECVDALGNGTIIYSRDQSDIIYNQMQEEYRFTFFGRIDEKYHTFKEFSNKELLQAFSNEERCLILWSHGNDPVIETDVVRAINHLEDLLTLSPDIWIYKKEAYIVECYHDGVIRKFRNKEE